MLCDFHSHLSAVQDEFSKRGEGKQGSEQIELLSSLQELTAQETNLLKEEVLSFRFFVRLDDVGDVDCFTAGEGAHTGGRESEHAGRATSCSACGS